MGYYLSALVAGGLLGRVGVALAAAAVGWRVPLVALALLPAGSALRDVADAAGRAAAAAPGPRGGRAARRACCATGRCSPRAAPGAGAFLAFVGVFSYVTVPAGVARRSGGTTTASGLVFVLWVLGGLGPVAGRFTDRFGWRRGGDGHARLRRRRRAADAARHAGDAPARRSR